MKTFGKFGTNFVLIDHGSGTQISLSREEGKDFCRFLMVELNIVDAVLNDKRQLSEIDSKFRNLVSNRNSQKGEK